MNILAVITGIVIALAFLGAGMAKVTKHEMMVQAAEHLGFSMSHFQLIGAAEIAGAVGVIAGVVSNDLDALGIAAAAGLAIVGVGAVINHLKAGDAPQDAAPPGILAVIAVVHIVATAAS